jgi:hypothetical protein
MHGMYNFKIINAQQSEITKSFRNSKQHLLKTYATIWLNKFCRVNHLTPSTVPSENRCACIKSVESD